MRNENIQTSDIKFPNSKNRIFECSNFKIPISNNSFLIPQHIIVQTSNSQTFNFNIPVFDFPKLTFSNPKNSISEFTKSDCVFIPQSHNNELITEIESSFSFFWLPKPHVVTDAHSAFKSSSTGPVRESFHALFW